MPESAPQSPSPNPTFRRIAHGISLFPLLKTAKGYNRSLLSSDLKAAANVSLLAFPQGLAYAAIAGLPLSYGIFGSAIACIVGMFFAGSKFVVLGPTNATSVMIMSAFATLGVSGEAAVSQMPLLLIFVGLALVIGAYLRVASLIQYISRTVITGYITAAAALIIANQIRKTLGFEFTAAENIDASTFAQSIFYTLKHIQDTQLPTLGLSVGTFALYIGLSRISKKLPNVAITLTLSSLAAYWLQENVDGFSVAFLEGMDTSKWGLTLPKFDHDAVNDLLPIALAISLLCVLEGNSIGKSLAAREGARINGNQEMLSVGIANLSCSLLSGMAASGSLTRSQLNIDSGAKTPLSSLFAGVIILVIAFAVGGYFEHIPKASLAVVVIAIGVSLLNKHQIKIVTKTTLSDRITFFVTFLSGLFLALDFAIYIGAVCSIALFMKKVANPEIVEYRFDDEGQLGKLDKAEQRNDPEVSIVHVEGELFFGAAELFRDQMRRVSDDTNLKVVVMKLRNAHNLDATSCMALEELIAHMNERNRILLVSEARPDTLRILRNSGLDEIIEQRNLFPDEENNPTLSTAKALRRAKEIIGDREAKVSIYAKEQRPDS